ncbi:MAG TPA: pentapeptide repeat-containing protein, partial [Azospirillaceae bacterium]|nr:pentapeptide repeat-containing protein [Azospirillaceae bacterium]
MIGTFLSAWCATQAAGAGTVLKTQAAVDALRGKPAQVVTIDTDGRLTLRGVPLAPGSTVRADLSKADLSGADLRGIDLSKAILTSAKLDGTKLDGAVLPNLGLEGA